jgi:UDP-GlcNAc:undecaprenyl-phosphate/decaprenyl-phosphate GlcNAc-1-phosphate transferase
MVLLGWWDDRKALSPAIKFAGQFTVCLLVAAAGIRATIFIPSILFSYTITILWILTITNAINFNDNMNGLCAGLALVASLAFGWIAARNGQYLVALLAFTTVGSVAGFLPYNFPKARVFLGDAGSHLVGYLLAILAILPHFYSPKHDANRPLAVFSPLLILAVPLVDLLWVTWSRTRRGQPFWTADTNHLSHRLVRLGLTKVQAVLVLWFIALAFASLTLFTVH